MSDSDLEYFTEIAINTFWVSYSIDKKGGNPKAPPPPLKLTTEEYETL